MTTTTPCRKTDVEFVVWYDAVSEWTRGQFDEVSNLSLAKNVNLGWVVHENDIRIVLANGVSSTGEFDYLLIPTPNIIERIRIVGGNRRGEKKAREKVSKVAVNQKEKANQ